MINRFRSVDIYLMLAFLIGVIVLVSYNQYVFFDNNTNHTGMSVRFIAGLYLCLALVSLYLWRTYNGLLPVLCVILGVIGAGEIYLLDYCNVMLSYEDWLRRGQPVRTHGCWFLNN